VAVERGQAVAVERGQAMAVERGQAVAVAVAMEGAADPVVISWD
jgi:hypothetical protein